MVGRAKPDMAVQRDGSQSGDYVASLVSRAWGAITQAEDGVVRLNERGQITAIDSRALHLLHAVSPASSGRDFWEAVPADTAEQYQSVTGRALKTSGRHAFVAQHEFAGSWIQYTFTRRAAGYVVKLRDVSSTQKLQSLMEDSERFNQLIFEANPNAMWVFDAASLRILAVNQAAVEFYGISRKLFMTLSMGALFPDGEGGSLASTLNSSVQSSDARFVPQLCKQRKAGGELVLVELACGRVNRNGHPAFMVSLADVTERHIADRSLRRINSELEQELAEARQALRNTNHDLSAFTYALSNDLQGPLHAVDGFATMLGDKYAAALDQTGRHYVNRIQASTRQLAKLVGDLRTLVQLPPLASDLEKVDLEPLCHSLVDNLRRRDPSRIVTVELDGSLLLRGDKRLLATALACLLENAWLFTSKKAEGWIKLGLQPGTVPDELILRVADNGAGFDAAYSDKLFTAFQRLHSSADFPGHGLGLAIVKRVAERHDGRVWAETDDAGARFFMAFPQGAAGIA